MVGAHEDTSKVEPTKDEVPDSRRRNAEIERTLQLGDGSPSQLKAVVIVGENERVAASSFILD